MSPTLIAALIALIEELIQQEPAIALELHQIFTTPNPSVADWQALREKVLSETFESLAPNAAANLPAPSPTPELPLADPKSDEPAVTQPGPVTPATSQPVVASANICPTCGNDNQPNAPGNCNC